MVSFAAVTSRDGAAIAAFVSPDPQNSPAPPNPQGPLADGRTLPVPFPPQAQVSAQGLAHALPWVTHLPLPGVQWLAGLCCGIPLLLSQVFGIILVSVFAYDAFKIYRTEMVPRAAQGECLSSGERRCPLPPNPATPLCPIPPGSIFTGDQQ